MGILVSTNEHGLEFFDGYDLKFDEAVAKKLGIGPKEGAMDKDGKKLTLDKFLNDANKCDFTEDQQAALLDQANWTVRSGTKLDNLLKVLFGKRWINSEMDFDPDNLEGKEFIAKVYSTVFGQRLRGSANRRVAYTSRYDEKAVETR